MKHRLDASVPDVPDTPRWEPFALVVLLCDAMHRFEPDAFSVQPRWGRLSIGANLVAFVILWRLGWSRLLGVATDISIRFIQAVAKQSVASMNFTGAMAEVQSKLQEAAQTGDPLEALKGLDEQVQLQLVQPAGP